MTIRQRIARCAVKIQKCPSAAEAATSESERYGQTLGRSGLAGREANV
jgi:hypothetical protein